MNKTFPKLRLHRETVHRLDTIVAGDLARVRGGATNVVGIVSTDNEADCDTHMSGPR
ncbi:MAG TPA: hypothetical protein VGE98_06740 [Thermoanaerobaculia bacterium]